MVQSRAHVSSVVGSCFNFHPTGLFGCKNQTTVPAWFVLRKDNIFLDTAGIGTGFTLVDYVMINGDQSACVSYFCAIIAFLWRFVCQDREHIT